MWLTRQSLLTLKGNTCRSPIAEAIFKNYVEKMGYLWDVDSAALRGYHVGEGPNHRTLDILAKNGIENYYHIARVVSRTQFLLKFANI